MACNGCPSAGGRRLGAGGRHGHQRRETQVLARVVVRLSRTKGVPDRYPLEGPQRARPRRPEGDEGVLSARRQSGAPEVRQPHRLGGPGPRHDQPAGLPEGQAMTDRRNADGLAEAIARALPIGRQTEERACRVLEQQLGAVWAAVLESHGYDPDAGYRVTLAGLLVEPLGEERAGAAPGNGWTAAATSASRQGG